MSLLKKDALTYLIKIEEESRRKATSIGLLINSGGIVGILTYSHGKLTAPLSIAFMWFIASIVSLFIVEMISMHTASRSIEQLLKENEGSNVDLAKLWFFNSFIKGARYFINAGAVASGCYAMQICINFINAGGG